MSASNASACFAAVAAAPSLLAAENSRAGFSSPRAGAVLTVEVVVLPFHISLVTFVILLFLRQSALCVSHLLRYSYLLFAFINTFA